MRKSLTQVTTVKGATRVHCVGSSHLLADPARRHGLQWPSPPRWAHSGAARFVAVGMRFLTGPPSGRSSWRTRSAPVVTRKMVNYA